MGARHWLRRPRRLHIGPMRRTLPLATTLGLVFAATAIASVPSGGYTGHYGKHASAKVKFTVKKSVLHNFDAFVPAYCSLSGKYEVRDLLRSQGEDPLRKGQDDLRREGRQRAGDQQGPPD